MGGCMSRKTGDFNPQKDLKDLTGKVAIVTGGNTGIGYHTVKFLARKGAKVYLGARNEVKAREAIAQLEQEGLGSGQVVWLQVNLADPQWAQMAAEDFLEKEKRLDILSAHFSQFVFTRVLLPLMIKTAKLPKSDVRIISVGSIAHTQKRAMNPYLKFEMLQDFNQEFASDFYPDWSRYSMTKLTAILFARELQKRLDEFEIPIISIPIHPGEVNTFGDRTPWPFLANIMMELFFMRPEAGSYTSCFAAASPLIEEFPEKYRYAYLEPVGHIGTLSPNALSVNLASQLWDTTEKILKDLKIELPLINP
ncbi:NAD(P)-binding protein [Pholiota conissans]|uniref:NAD(P)-binding protein n=1 Tax=Pholiota conissans TaxID=109636 RepID=A0A9P5ZDT4_9AGAR|nr:NAD(P)-binding protein [Pholiota conissans]